MVREWREKVSTRRVVEGCCRGGEEGNVLLLFFLVPLRSNGRRCREEEKKKKKKKKNKKKKKKKRRARARWCSSRLFFFSSSSSYVIQHPNFFILPFYPPAELSTPACLLCSSFSPALLVLSLVGCARRSLTVSVIHSVSVSVSVFDVSVSINLLPLLFVFRPLTPLREPPHLLRRACQFPPRLRGRVSGSTAVCLP